ncbi:cytochrome P450 3A18-like [Musca vetustissima]|uniref:cytochrome P450 3A18-like n=1 Tax=Musca vetustissima TaxID=27455 RepID=UPI002AB5E01D|nr:cytochrome P450 3A18-like [Musca vetustissima]
MRQPVLMIRDPELVKQILIKDFDHFVNRQVSSSGATENLFSHSLFMMENDKWRDMRSTLSPAFTGSKMRQMFQLMVQTVDEAMAYLRSQQWSMDGIDVDMKDLTTRLTNDIIASTAFGLQVNSFRDKENEFYIKAKRAVSFTGLQQVKMLFIVIFPKLAEKLKMDIFEKSFTDYFMNLVLGTMKYRQEHNIHRPDMINLLMEARGMIPTEVQKTHFRQWTDMEVVAQCLAFLFAGFEPSSGVMSFAAHELMENSQVQEKLYEEIHGVDEELHGKPVSYELLQKMPYMEMVVSEVLRKWPVAGVTDRICNKDFEYVSKDTGERVIVKKGEKVRISMCGFQRDPTYFENPNVFDPERFSAENKMKIDHGTYLPFGVGSRNCIGTRFALLEVKVFLYYLLRDYHLEPCAKSCIPLVLDPTKIQLLPKGGFWLKLKPRKRHKGMVYGAFDNRQPLLMIRDPELIKQIMIKDFDHFVNRQTFPGSSENFFANSLFMLENDKWRDMRSTLSPAFTGSKMRQMFQLMLQTVDEAMSYLKVQQNSVHGFDVDIKDLSTRLTNDIIASTAFGLQVNSFRDKDNEFYIKAKNAVNFSGLQQLKMIFIMIFPKLAEMLSIDIFEKSFTEYFMHLVLDTMKYRQEHNIHRPDMINLLMEASGMIPTDIQKTHFRQWSDIEIVAQCLLFLFAGFEPSSGVMSFAAHELMENPQVQEKLYEEIRGIDKDLQGKSVTYELLQKMPYMDMVISEVLRKWPVTLVTDRTCTKDFEYKSPESGENIVIKKGEKIRVSLCGLQRDPKYFENPDQFNPERFSVENRGKIEIGTYLPFGLGPRNCIGNRFALLEVKAFLYYLLRDYRLEVSPKTSQPLTLDPANIQLLPKGGFWLKCIPRKC